MPKPDIKLLKLTDIDESIRLQTGISWTIYGMKKADSLNRNLMLRGYEEQAINNKTQKVYPFSVWKNGDVLRYIKMNRLPEPIQYGKKKSNGVSFDIDVFLYLQEHYPGDLQKILTAFPMAEQILFEYGNKVSG
jgi:sulfate adenylyltransferase subunit 2